MTWIKTPRKSIKITRTRLKGPQVVAISLRLELPLKQWQSIRMLITTSISVSQYQLESITLHFYYWRRQQPPRWKQSKYCSSKSKRTRTQTLDQREISIRTANVLARMPSNWSFTRTCSMHFSVNDSRVRVNDDDRPTPRPYFKCISSVRQQQQLILLSETCNERTANGKHDIIIIIIKK